MIFMLLLVLVVLVLLYFISFSSIRKIQEAYGGRGGGRHHIMSGGGRGGGRRHYIGSGGGGYLRGRYNHYGGGHRNYGYAWYSPWYLFRGNYCKDGCTNIGNGIWGCQYPGNRPTDCQFSSDCDGCNYY